MNPATPHRILRGAALLLGGTLALSALGGSSQLSVAGLSITPAADPQTANFTVSRNGDLSYAAVLQYRTVDDTALAGTDYTAAAGQVLLEAGAASAQIPVTIAASQNASADRRFTLQLDGASGIGGAGLYGSRTASSTGSLPGGFAGADFDADGDIDLVTSIRGSDGPIGAGNLALSVNRTAAGAATASFDGATALVTGGSPGDLATADINADGKPDLLGLENASSTGSLFVFVNQTVTANSPAFAALVATPVDNQPRALALADFDGDGRPDAAVAQRGNANARLLLNNTTALSATASFVTTSNHAVGSAPEDLVAADFNSDGKLDLAVATSFSNSVSVLINTTTAVGATSFQLLMIDGFAGAKIAAGDFNRDSKPDLVLVQATSTDSVTVLLNTSTASAVSFASTLITDVGGSANNVVVGDHNLDGLTDLVVSRTGSTVNTYNLMRNRTVAGSAVAHFDRVLTVDAGVNPLHPLSADLDGDGKPDLASPNAQNLDTFAHPATLSVLLNAATAAPGIQDPTVTPASVTGTLRYAAADTTPEPFSFASQSDVPTGSLRQSTTATISGFDALAAVSVTGGEYSVGCTGSFTSAAGQISNGQGICLRHTAATVAATATDTTVTIGGVSAVFRSTTAAATPVEPTPDDTTPNSFGFAVAAGVATGSVQQSDTVAIGGITAPAAVTVSGGEYSIGCTGSFTAAPGQISNGQTVCLRHTAASTPETAVETMLLVGGVTGIFRSTTAAAPVPAVDTMPDAFSFAEQRDVIFNSEVRSAAATINGINAPAAITVSGGEYSIGCDIGSYTRAAGQISNGQTLCLRHTSVNALSSVTETTVTVGGVSAVFRSRTFDPDPTTDTQGGSFGGAALTLLTAVALLRRRRQVN